MIDCYQATIGFATDKKTELCDITSRIQEEVTRSNVEQGYALVFSPHTTSGIIINENESRLVKDFETALNSLFPHKQKYLHDDIDNNASAHIAGSLVGNQAYIIVEGGGLRLGRWQSVFFVELDGPRTREVFVQVFGEKS